MLSKTPLFNLANKNSNKNILIQWIPASPSHKDQKSQMQILSLQLSSPAKNFCIIIHEIIRLCPTLDTAAEPALDVDQNESFDPSSPWRFLQRPLCSGSRASLICSAASSQLSRVLNIPQFSMGKLYLNQPLDGFLSKLLSSFCQRLAHQQCLQSILHLTFISQQEVIGIEVAFSSSSLTVFIICTPCITNVIDLCSNLQHLHFHLHIISEFVELLLS